jgi:hypothetical protein
VYTERSICLEKSMRDSYGGKCYRTVRTWDFSLADSSVHQDRPENNQAVSVMHPERKPNWKTEKITV